MNHTITTRLLVGSALLASAGHAVVQSTPSHEGPHPTVGQAVGRISITNLSNQGLAPVVVATHRPGVTPIIVPGRSVGYELATRAETGIPQALAAMLKSAPSVLFATRLTGMATVIAPGERVAGDFEVDYGLPVWDLLKPPELPSGV